jgi:hypothetical protein
MPSFERECPICFKAYSWERLRLGPGGKCVHGFCEPCGESMAQALKEPPFRCPMCREDITKWFVEQFDWTSEDEQRSRRYDQLREAYYLRMQNHLWPAHLREVDQRVRARCGYDPAVVELMMFEERLRGARSQNAG